MRSTRPGPSRHSPSSAGPAIGQAQLVGRHRPDVFLLARDGTPQVGVRRQVGVEIGAQGDDDGDGTAQGHGRHQVRHEGGSLLLVAAQSEELLELVDDQQHPGVFASPPASSQPTRDEVERPRLPSQLLDERGGRAQRATRGAQAKRQGLQRMGSRRDHDPLAALGVVVISARRRDRL